MSPESDVTFQKVFCVSEYKHLWSTPAEERRQGRRRLLTAWVLRQMLVGNWESLILKKNLQRSNKNCTFKLGLDADPSSKI